MTICKLQGIALLLRRSYRSTPLSPTMKSEEAGSSLFVDRFRINCSNRLQGQTITRSRNSVVRGENNSIRAPPSPPSGPTPRFPVWIRWFAGSIISLILSMWRPKWSTLLRIGGEAEAVMKEAEQAAEVVEKVATVAEQVAEEVAGQLSDQNKLKEAATLVENISKEAAKDAHLADQIIHQVDNVEKDLENLETLVEPIINKITHQKP